MIFFIKTRIFKQLSQMARFMKQIQLNRTRIFQQVLFTWLTMSQFFFWEQTELLKSVSMLRE